MPESAELTTQPRTPEGPLTPEEREEFSELILEFSAASVLDPNRETVSLRNRIHEKNGRLAEYILGEVSDGGLDQRGVYRHTVALEYCASPGEAERIGALLESDLIALDSDRSSKSRLGNILVRVGTVQAVPHCIEFARKTFGAPYGRELHRADSVEVYTILSALEMRVPGEEDMRKIIRAKEEINNLLRENGLGPISSGEERSSREQAARVVAGFAAGLEYGMDEIQNEPEENDPANVWTGSAHRLPDLAEQAYVKNKFSEVEARIDVVKRLRHEARVEKEIKEEPEDDERKFLRRHWLEYREKHPSPFAPTLGIEIEIREETILPEELHNKNIYGLPASDYIMKSERRSQMLAEVRKRFKKTEVAGVPHSYDKFWEFSHRPVRNYLTLSREVQALIEMGLISKEDQKHPLHVTIGGVWCGRWRAGTVTVEKEASVLARMLEASGWATRGRRLLRPFYSKRDCWAHKGEAGLLQKTKENDRLEFGAENAVEIRTLQLQTISGLDRLLRSAYLLGAALKTYQEEGKMPGYFPKSTERRKLADIWGEFSRRAAGLFIEFGLSSPFDLDKWKNPREYSDQEVTTGIKEGFWGLAALLDQAEQDPKSRGADFVRNVRKLIIETRAEIAPIIYPQEGSESEKN